MKAGDYVWYKERAPHLGRVKRIGEHFVWVVFWCGGDWANYERYDAAGCLDEHLEVLELPDERIPGY